MTRSVYCALGALPVLLVSVVFAESTAEYPYVTGSIASEISATDVAEIQEGCQGKSLKPWVIEARSVTTEPRSSWMTQVYMVPEVFGKRVRRGRTVECAGRLITGSTTDRTWACSSEIHHYVQVSLSSGGFGVHLLPPGPLELPFQVSGEFEDQELVNLIEYVRYKAPLTLLRPSRDPDTTIAPLVSTGLERIFLITRDSVTNAKVWTEDTVLSGFVYSARVAGGSWVVTETRAWERYPMRHSSDK